MEKQGRMIRVSIAGQTAVIRGDTVEAQDPRLNDDLQAIAGEGSGYLPPLMGAEENLLQEIRRKFPEARVLRWTPYRSPRLKPGEVF
jgi:hypothetical protein